MKYSILLLCLCASFFAIAQAPNTAYRLPETSDMPEWAKKIYINDAALNVVELDAAFQPWKLTYDSLKMLVKEAGIQIDDDLQSQFKYYKKYYKYYSRWRYSVAAYMQADGSLDFKIAPPALSNRDPLTENNSTTWELVGPKITYWAKNDVTVQTPAPWQSNIYSIDVAPSNTNIVYYGTETGALGKTTDKGDNWTPIGLDNINFRTGVGAIAVHQTDPNTVYAGNNTGVHKSTDGGTTWTHAFNSAGFNTNDIKVNPDVPAELLAAGGSLQRYTVAGGWASIVNRQTYDLAFKPGNSNIVYALVKNAAGDLCEFLKSTDGGASFGVITNGWIGNLGDGGGRMTVSPINPNRIYVVLLTNSGPRVLRSDDSGDNWVITALGGTVALGMTNGQGYYDLSITMSHTNANHLVVATTTAYKSTDSGVTYTAVGGYTGSFGIHPDVQEMKTMGGDSWIATDGGISLSTDFWTNTSNFSPKLNGLTGTHFWGFDIGWNEDAVVGGRYHNGNTAWHENYPAGEFLRMGGAEEATGYINPGNGRMAYFSDLGGGGRLLPSSINQNYGNFTVTKFPNEAYTSMEWSEQEWDPRNYYTYYIGKDNILWRTTNNGGSFTALFTHSDAAAKVMHIEVSRTDPDVIYCNVQRSGSGELWKSINGGGVWAQCANPVGPSASQRRISNVAVSGTNANTIWWCFRNGPNGNKIFKSTDGGTIWSNITTSELNGITLADMVHQLGTDGGVYLNGDYGEVFYRNNTMPKWVSYKTGLPRHLNTEISRIKIQYKKKKLRMASVNGIWEVDLFENSTTTLPQPMVDKQTMSCSRDTLQLESYSVVNGAATYQWAISPAPQWISNTNIRNPKLVLGTTMGQYSVTLTVTDDNGTTSRTISNLINNLPIGDLCKLDTIPGKALLLDGVDDFALPERNLNLNSNRVTMTAWIKRNGAQVNFSGILYWRGGTTSCGLSITDANALRYTWDEQGGSYNFNTGFTIPDNVWTHVALVITPTNAKVYMNGVAATRTAAHAAEAFDTPLQIGFDNGSRYFKGQIDEVSIWNRSLPQDSIRELMHLTLNPANESRLVDYYQFNEPSSAAQDKASTVHANLLGDATRTTSTCPIGKGFSARRTVAGSGSYQFGSTGLTLTFPASGPYPNGELCATRINQSPDQLPIAQPHGRAYWVVNNFGSNSSFANLTSLLFEDYANIPANAISTDFKLYKRGSFAEGSTWGIIPIDEGDVVVPGVHGSILFSTGNSVTSFSQLIVSTSTVLLPIEWLEFKAVLENRDRVRLNWKVNQTGNVSHFEVEKSNNGLDFKAINQITATLSTGTLSYEDFDLTPQQGRNYYRIKTVDTDGKHTYSLVRLVQIDALSTEWAVYPNPLNSGKSLMIQAPSEADYFFILYDAVGKKIFESTLNGPSEITLQALPPGVYAYEIVTESTRSKGQLIVVP